MKKENIFEKLDIPLDKKLSRSNVKDVEAHYDIDGVSIDPDGVIISGDNQTTMGAPVSYSDSSRFRIRTSSSSSSKNKGSETKA